MRATRPRHRAGLAAESVATCATVSITSARSSPAREPACAHTTGGHAARPSKRAGSPRSTASSTSRPICLRLDCHLFEVPVDVETQVDTSGAFLVTTSTVGRELMFVISHTIHHNALIARLLDERAITWVHVSVSHQPHRSSHVHGNDTAGVARVGREGRR